MGLTTFKGLTLKTAPGSVMSPRPASERLVAAACARIEGRARVADVGTGSGAIAIAIAHCRPRAEVWATDIDERAVALARENVACLDLADRVFVRLGDLLEPVSESLDVIVANLPYLAACTAADYPDLAAEPFNAIFAGGRSRAIPAPTRGSRDQANARGDVAPPAPRTGRSCQPRRATGP
jgi:release factor glutamine methyltransferase